jgi:2-polyprenyl-6-methoxyphenol hydroxylase-like FAD-dependent oxidoreductase
MAVNEKLRTKCCIVGGGPAGVMLGYLLAREGIAVTVLEKHKDFFRDFRGDTVHPSTLQVLHELGILADFLKVPHQQIAQAGAKICDLTVQVADFRRLPTRCKFIALMPQWDFLAFLSDQGKRYSGFDLRMSYKATELLHDGRRVTGVRASTPEGLVEITADLVIGCDGRHSTIRGAAGFEVIEKGVPIDVLWFHISRHSNDPAQVLGNVNYGKALILINRGGYYQAGLIIPKGSFDAIKQQGLERFRSDLVKIAPFLGDRVNELQDWEAIKLLSVQINRLKRWHRPGLLCIGDAAHAMSPAGGVGINYAIQDAVATANLLSPALRDGNVSERLLAQVQRRRELPTRIVQQVQAFAHRGLAYVFLHPGEATAPTPFRVIIQLPGIKHVIGRFIGMGPRPEHVRNPVTPRPRSEGMLQAAVMLGGACGAVVLGARMLRKNRPRTIPRSMRNRTERPGVH